MPRTPRPLTSALAAALAAGAVVAVTAVADPSADRPKRATPSAGWRAAPPPTRLEAINDAVAARDELEAAVAKELSKTPEQVRAAARTVVVRRLDEQVTAKRLTAEQRDALVACFDDPVGCKRDALPVPRDGDLPPGLVRPGLAGQLIAPPVAVAPRPLTAAQRRALARRRAALRKRRGSTRPARPVPAPPPAPILRPAYPAIPLWADPELAKALGVKRQTLAKALVEAGPAGRRAVGDPDGVPLGLVGLPTSLVVSAAPAPAVVVPSAPAPSRPPVMPRAPRAVPATPAPAPPTTPSTTPAVPAPASP
ncbi:hypothetical protein [Conexibacter sp. SYSU D00693]|uniref:hypothetical protein n=1 Tax=Conexibacter sp. SYSU D00693 TaxID=2812560 RepID=UPI00196AB5E4|nr:hypothetical protein [Conexibacter sp. SYSU D00693]